MNYLAINLTTDLVAGLTKGFFIFLLTSLSFCSLNGQEQPTIEESVTKAEVSLQKLIDENIAVGLAAGVARDGDIIWQQHVGHADKKNKQAFDANTVSRMASIAKPMTCVAILQLQEQGLLDLDATIDTYLPNYPKDKAARIKVKQLMQHSSGIGAYKNKKENNNKNYYKNFNDAMDVFSKRKLEFDPGSSFGYTSYGYTVLGAIIESVSGMSYEDYMQEKIWDVAGMKSISIEYSNKTYEHQSVSYHRKSNGKIKEADELDLSDRVPAGGFHSTVEDILKFGMALVDGRLISKASLDIMAQDTGLKKEGNGYGLGFYLYGDNPQLGNVVGHTGTQLGCSSFMMLFPDTKSVIVTASNTSGILQQVSDITVGLFGLAHAAGQ